MSKNGKGHNKLHSHGCGRRAYKHTCHLNSATASGCAFYYLQGLPLYTPVRHIATKTGHIAQHIMEERLYRRHRQEYLEKLRRGVYLFEKEEGRKRAIEEVLRELNEPGLVSKDWKGSNRHDQARLAAVPATASAATVASEESSAPNV